MNQAQTMQAIRKLGLSVSRTGAGEYRITPGGEAAAYYTTDADDALATARAMAARRAAARYEIDAAVQALAEIEDAVVTRFGLHADDNPEVFRGRVQAAVIIYAAQLIASAVDECYKGPV